MNPHEFASLLIDICAKSKLVKDYSLDIHENVIVRSRIFLTAGFLEVYRNFETGKVAFAWLIDDERSMERIILEDGTYILTRTRPK